MASRYFYGTGRRKAAVAQVRVYPGEGEVIINGKPAEEYFTIARHRTLIAAPLKAAGMTDRFTVMVKVRGGGVSGQADAVQHGLARALVAMDADLKTVMRKGGFITRDPRVKERKKPGLKRARKAPQYTKR